MKNLVKMTMFGTMFSVLATVNPAFADSVQSDQQKVQADQGAISKDDQAMSKDNDALAKDRAAKADAKANGNYDKQAGASMAIGVDQAAIGEKKMEKSADQKILEHHQKELNADSAKESDTSDSRQ